MGILNPDKAIWDSDRRAARILELEGEVKDLKCDYTEVIHYLRLILPLADIEEEMKHAIGSYIRDYDEMEVSDEHI